MLIFWVLSFYASDALHWCKLVTKLYVIIITASEFFTEDHTIFSCIERYHGCIIKLLFPSSTYNFPVLLKTPLCGFTPPKSKKFPRISPPCFWMHPHFLYYQWCILCVGGDTCCTLSWNPCISAVGTLTFPYTVYDMDRLCSSFWLFRILSQE